MSFRVKFPDGRSVYINGRCESVFTTYAQMERKAVEMAQRIGGEAFYDNGLPRFQKDGVDLFPRWIPVSEPLPAHQIELSNKLKPLNTLEQLS